MKPERWHQIERAFEQALELSEEERQAFLSNVCDGDDELRTEVESLLESHRRADELFDRPSLFLPEDTLANRRDVLLPGRVIGRYRIIHEIGCGGMGEVYLAARADEQYEKQVAIKLIKRGMDTEAVLRQFRNERQILASFDHPNIARLLDADTTEEGLPYFVMEYVEGVPVDRYCDSQSLNITARLDLFRQTCAAVAYAHRHLVIHRDIKPSNILVTKDGMPKLLDFGIAKILQPGVDGPVTATLTGLRLMTPEYASPEQVRGLTVTTLSDVYSLGVVLYQLLTGQAPYQFTDRSPLEVARAITETTPQRPSAVIQNAVGSATDEASKLVQTCEGTPERLCRRLRGDLDNIVLTALRKEPERRYQSVEQLSEDILRHLRGLPVNARKDTLTYRGVKFVRRNRVVVAAAAIVLLFLLAGILTTTWQARKARTQEALARFEKARAERRFNEVRQLAHSVLFDYHDAIKDLPGATRVRERLVKDALAYLDGLAVEASEDPSLQRELATAYERVGDVSGETYGANLGDQAGALESYEKALRLREQLFASGPHDLQNRRELAGSYKNVGNRLLQTSEAARGMEDLRKALALYVEMATECPNDKEILYKLASMYNDLGLASEDWGDIQGALANHRKALPLREEFQAADPGNRQRRRELAVTYVNLGRALVLSGDIKSGLESNQKALTICAPLADEDPLNTGYRRLVAITYQNDGDYRSMMGDKNGALASFRKKLALDERSLADDPSNAQARSDLGYTCKRVGDLLIETRNYSQALLYHHRALELWEPLAKNALQKSLHLALVKTHASIGLAHAKVGDLRSALTRCAQAMSILANIEDDPTSTSLRTLRAEAYTDLATAYVALAMAPHSTAVERREHQRVACEMYRQSRDIWLDLRERGIISGVDASKPDEVQREIAKCEKK